MSYTRVGLKDVELGIVVNLSTLREMLDGLSMRSLVVNCRRSKGCAGH